MRNARASKPKVQTQIAKQFYTEQALADVLGLSIYTLRYWRKHGYGPPYTKLADGHSRCLYRRTSVERWLKNAERPSRGGELRAQ